MSSRTDRATQRNPVSKNHAHPGTPPYPLPPTPKKKKKKKKTEEEEEEEEEKEKRVPRVLCL